MPTVLKSLIIRAESAWIDEVKSAAAAAGVNQSDYIRAAVTAHMQRDGLTPPDASPRKPGEYAAPANGRWVIQRESRIPCPQCGSTQVLIDRKQDEGPFEVCAQCGADLG